MYETDTAPAGSAPGSAEARPWRAPDVAQPDGGALTAARLAEIEKQARDDGYRRGLEEGRRAGEEEMRRHAAQLGRLLEAMRPEAGILDDHLLEQLGELVIVITRQLVRRELRHQPGEIVRVVREALAVLPVSDATIRVFLHPDDAGLVRRALQVDVMERHVKVLDDVTQSPGGTRVETDVSAVDASVEQRLSAIAAHVFGDERAPTADAAQSESDE